MTQNIIEQLTELVTPERIYINEPMSRHVTFRVGGPAEVLVQPDISQLAAVLALCRQENIPYTVIGNGSNLLVSDRGVRGVVIEIAKPMSEITIDGSVIRAEAGAMLSKAAAVVAKAGLTGMEFASGIPGTIGGAVVMNAGAYGGEMSQIIRSVTVLDTAGRQKVYDVGELELSYRHSRIMETGDIVLAAELVLAPGDSETIFGTMQELAAKRMEKQPLEYPSAGSTFKRPEGYFAGKLIMDAGLRGCSIGGAQVAEKHCGFVINKGDATEADISALMKHIQEEVFRQFGVTLEPEVRKLGEFE